MAKSRIHGTTGERPDRRMVVKRNVLLSLPALNQPMSIAVAKSWSEQPVPLERLQNPLSVYARYWRSEYGSVARTNLDAV